MYRQFPLVSFISVNAILLISSVLLPANSAIAGQYSGSIALPDAIASKAGPHGAYDPHSTLSPEQHIQVALQHQQEGRMSAALDTLSIAISRHADSKDLYAVRGSLYLEKGKAAAALSDFNHALAIAPDDATLLTNRAQALRQFGRIGEALSDLNRAVEIDPDLLAARFNRGAIYYSSREFDKALIEFDQCIAIDPHLPGPYFNRASTRHELGNTPGAKADMDRFIQLSGNDEWKQSAQELLKRWDTPGS